MCQLCVTERHHCTFDIHYSGTVEWQHIKLKKEKSKWKKLLFLQSSWLHSTGGRADLQAICLIFTRNGCSSDGNGFQGCACVRLQGRRVSDPSGTLLNADRPGGAAVPATVRISRLHLCSVTKARRIWSLRHDIERDQSIGQTIPELKKNSDWVYFPSRCWFCYRPGWF